MVDSSEQYVVHEEKGEGRFFLKKKKEEREIRNQCCAILCFRMKTSGWLVATLTLTVLDHVLGKVVCVYCKGQGGGGTWRQTGCWMLVFVWPNWMLM